MNLRQAETAEKVDCPHLQGKKTSSFSGHGSNLRSGNPMGSEDSPPSTSYYEENQLGSTERKRRGITMGHVVIGVMAAVAVGNIMTLRKRLLHIERLHNAAQEAGRQRQRIRTAQEEYMRAKARQESERRAQAEAEEELRQQTRYQHIRMEEERERDRFRRAYARWQRQSQQHQQQEQQHHYWDGQSFGHGWSEEEADDWRWQHQSRGRAESRSRIGPRGASEHWHTLGLNRKREEPFSPAEIKAAFRAKALEYHPDKNPTNPEEAAKKFRQVLDAYHALTGHRG